MWNKIKKDDLKVGDKVMATDGGGQRTCTSISLTGGSANLNNWGVNLRSDGYWGGNGSSGYLMKDKTPKVIVTYALEGRSDPTEEFESLEKAKKRVVELIAQTSPRVVNDSIRVYSVSQAYKISTAISLKKI